jgi:lysophospholipase L1-like esterase
VNAFGLRGPDVAAERPPDALRVLFLGDSVTWGGSYVDDDALFSARAVRVARDRMPTRFRTAEALNAGVNAWGPGNILGLLDAGVLPAGLGSQAWVITVLEDDFRRDKTRIGEVPYFNVAPRTAWEELLVLAAYRVVTAYKRPRPAAELDQAAAENLTALGAIAARGHAAGARVLFVWHPAADAVGGALEPHRQALFALAEGATLPVLDLTPTYRHAGGARRLYADGMHLTAAGHAVAGEAIGTALAGILTGR